MILVLLGTQNNSFHRLLEKIDDSILKQNIQEEVIVQAGYTKYQSSKMQIFDLIAKEELEKLQEQANIIITHGGVGSIISSIQKGKKVIAVPRKHEYEEHVNNHQQEIVELFNQKGYIIGIKDVENLEEALKNINSFQPKRYEKNNQKIIQVVEDFIDKT